MYADSSITEAMRQMNVRLLVAFKRTFIVSDTFLTTSGIRDQLKIREEKWRRCFEG